MKIWTDPEFWSAIGRIGLSLLKLAGSLAQVWIICAALWHGFHFTIGDPQHPTLDFGIEPLKRFFTTQP